MLKALNIIEIRVKDWDSSLAWYQEKLGLKAEGLHEDPFCFLTFPEGDASIGLDGTEEVSGGGSTRCVPCIQVDDLQGTVTELKGRGVEFVADVTGGEEGYRTARLSDPEGNLIQLYEWI